MDVKGVSAENLFFCPPVSVDLATELGPAISLAYEPPEADIMLRPPRSLKYDRLVSRNLLFYSYLTIGVFESVACLLACE